MKHFPQLEIIPNLLEFVPHRKFQAAAQVIRVFNNQHSTPLDKLAITLRLVI